MSARSGQVFVDAGVQDTAAENDTATYAPVAGAVLNAVSRDGPALALAGDTAPDAVAARHSAVDAAVRPASPVVALVRAQRWLLSAGFVVVAVVVAAVVVAAAVRPAVAAGFVVVVVVRAAAAA
ncbi:MAG: hypothetical protein QOH96_626, partial [Blastocatellia bacterium]|nr:hypothetical protein [Blastocatellia bacterium]